MSKDYPWGKGTPKWTLDSTANDSDKSFTVPSGKIYDLKGIYAYLSATATVGNRSLAVSISDGTNVVWTSISSGNITASQTGQLFLNADVSFVSSTTVHRSLANSANLVNVQQEGALPSGCYLLPGYIIRVWDAGVADAAADDLTIVLHYIEYDA